jgi:hypothetical protein
MDDELVRRVAAELREVDDHMSENRSTTVGRVAP